MSNETEIRIQCRHCGARYRIAPEKLPARGARARCARCKEIFSLDPPRIRILVAKDDPDFHLFVRELLREQPLELLFAEDGVTALEMIQQEHPALVVLDVALPRIYGFELAEMLRSDPATEEIRIILLAAIHDKTRYKRQPESLYGADTYIEAHHLSDRLLPKIRALLPQWFAPKPGPQQPAAEPEGGGPAPVPSAEDEVRKRAARLARLILSDIALYNQKNVEDGIRNQDLEQRLAPELQEGKEMMKQRFPEFPEEERNALLQQEIARLMRKDRTMQGVP